MAHKKAAGSVKNGRDSISKRLGVKVFGSESVNSGEIIVRQRGTKFHPGSGVKRTSDDTLIATVDGVVAFIKKRVLAFNGNLKKRTFVEVVEASAKPAKKTTAKKASAATATKGTKLDHVESTLPKKKTTKKAAPKATETKKSTAKVTKATAEKKPATKKTSTKKPAAKKATTAKSTTKKTTPKTK